MLFTIEVKTPPILYTATATEPINAPINTLSVAQYNMSTIIPKNTNAVNPHISLSIS